jgi:alkylated DNA repair dioxygenase AlkB
MPYFSFHSLVMSMSLGSSVIFLFLANGRRAISGHILGRPKEEDANVCT